MQLSLTTAIVALAALTGIVVGETHTVRFDNRCGSGTPILIQGTNVLSTGANFTSSGPLISAVAYLQTGFCGFNGEGCTIIETTLVNPTTPDDGSLTAISLIAPHEFSVTSGFGYFNGCEGTGADCDSETCESAFHSPTDKGVPMTCEVDDVDLAITFCL